MKELLAKACEKIRPAFEVSHVSMLVKDEEDLVLQAHHGELTLRIPEGSKVPAGAGLWGRALRESKTIFDNDVKPDPSFLGIYEEAGSRMCIPLVSFGQTLGVLVLDSARAGSFSVSDIQSLESVADICATAIQNAHYVERVKHLAYLDGLTGIFNRRYFELRIQEELERARRFESGMAVIMVDIDQFKRLNDEFGHLLTCQHLPHLPAPAAPAADVSSPRMRPALLAVLIVAIGCTNPPPPGPAPDLILRGGTIYTLDPQRSQAEALAVRHGRIVAIGAGAEVRSTGAGAGTRLVDLGGRFVMPAFHDAHVHPVSAGVEPGQCNLNDLETAETTLGAIRACVDVHVACTWLGEAGRSLPFHPAGHEARSRSHHRQPPGRLELGRWPLALGELGGSQRPASRGRRRTPRPGASTAMRAGEPTGLLRESATALDDPPGPAAHARRRTTPGSFARSPR